MTNVISNLSRTLDEKSTIVLINDQPQDKIDNIISNLIIQLLKLWFIMLKDFVVCPTFL